MRDVVFSAVMVVLLILTLRRAHFGAYLWAWLSLANPHQLTYSFANSMPWAYMTVVATLLSLLFSLRGKSLPRSTGVTLMALLWLWMTITSVVSINIPAEVLERWIFVSKIMFMVFMTLMLIRGRQQTLTLLAVVVGSVGLFGVKGGLFTLLTGGSYHVWGPPGGMMEENNSFAVALIVCMPLVFYLRQIVAQRWLKIALMVSMVLMGASVLGSQSRGALVAMVSMLVFLAIKSKRMFRSALVLGVLVTAGINFMPESWTSRMDTIQNHEGETSAESRLYTWRTMWNVAVDRPLVGAGFRADNPDLFAKYAPPELVHTSFYEGKAWVAHSIYFQALGEHGFVGLLLWVGLWVWCWFAASRVGKAAEQVPALADWVPMLMRMCQVSVIGFCTGGAFLSLMNLDLPYYLVIFVVLCQRALADEQAAARLAPVGNAARPQPKAAGRPVGV